MLPRDKRSSSRRIEEIPPPLSALNWSARGGLTRCRRRPAGDGAQDEGDDAAQRRPADVGGDPGDVGVALVDVVGVAVGAEGVRGEAEKVLVPLGVARLPAAALRRHRRRGALLAAEVYLRSAGIHPI